MDNIIYDTQKNQSKMHDFLGILQNLLELHRKTSQYSNI